jgi:hypothetical protein
VFLRNTIKKPNQFFQETDQKTSAGKKGCLSKTATRNTFTQHHKHTNTNPHTPTLQKEKCVIRNIFWNFHHFWPPKKVSTSNNDGDKVLTLSILMWCFVVWIWLMVFIEFGPKLTVITPEIQTSSFIWKKFWNTQIAQFAIWPELLFSRVCSTS